MDTHRAKEILNSSEKINVQLNGQPVWIESVDSDTHTVQVQMGDEPSEINEAEKPKTVDAKELQEVE